MSNTNKKFYFDTEDYDKIKNYCWRECNEHIIAPISNSLETIGIHRLIMNCSDNKLVVDHINGNGFDNRKNNLRVCTQLLNSFNHKVNSINTSGITGVSFHKKFMKWRAYTTVNNKQVNLGYYYSFDEAVLARLKGEAKYFKEYSNNYKPELNLITLEYISRTDNQKHYIEINLDGEVKTNKTKEE